MSYLKQTISELFAWFTGKHLDWSLSLIKSYVWNSLLRTAILPNKSGGMLMLLQTPDNEERENVLNLLKKVKSLN